MDVLQRNPFGREEMTRPIIQEIADHQPGALPIDMVFDEPVGRDHLEGVGHRGDQECRGCETRSVDCFAHLPRGHHHQTTPAVPHARMQIRAPGHTPNVPSNEMTSRAMIVVGGGSSTRFGKDKLLTLVGGIPLAAHAVRSVASSVDKTVLVCRVDQIEEIRNLDLGVEVVAGGATRTRSEIAGLAALDEDHDLIGIHDAARPLVSRSLIDSLFEGAAMHGGAVPIVEVGLVVDRSTRAALPGLGAAQTPQVFQSIPLRSAYRAAEEERFEGQDTAEVVARYTSTRIVGIAGDPSNLKVTFPDDLDELKRLLEERSDSEPR